MFSEKGKKGNEINKFLENNVDKNDKNDKFEKEIKKWWDETALNSIAALEKQFNDLMEK